MQLELFGGLSILYKTTRKEFNSGKSVSVRKEVQSPIVKSSEGLRNRVSHSSLLFGQVLVKIVGRSGFSTLDYSVVEFYSKPCPDWDSPPSITPWSNLIENRGQIRILHHRLPFGQVWLKAVVRFGFSSLDFSLIEFYRKPWSDPDSPPSITLWSSFIGNHDQVQILHPPLPFDHVLFKQG